MTAGEMRYEELLRRMRTFAETVSMRQKERSTLKSLWRKKHLTETDNERGNEILAVLIDDMLGLMRIAAELGKCPIPPDKTLVVHTELEEIGDILVTRRRIDLLTAPGGCIRQFGGQLPHRHWELELRDIEERLRYARPRHRKIYEKLLASHKEDEPRLS